jgi:hypothetical protein
VFFELDNLNKVKNHALDYESNKMELLKLKQKHIFETSSKYLILDPFNHTYNPGKNIKKNHKDSLYPNVFVSCLDSILTKYSMSEFDQV